MRPASFTRIGAICAALGWLILWADARAQDKTADATRQYNAAVGLHNSEAYDLAAAEWVKFLNNHAKDPRTDRAWFYLGVCYSKQNKTDEASKAFQTVLASFPNSPLLPDAILNLGLAQYNTAHAGKPELYDAAAQTFNTLATKYPNGKYLAEAIYFQGECLYNRGKKKEAIEKYRLVVDQQSNHALAPRARLAMGVAQADTGEHQAALATYDAFLQKSPQDPLAAEVQLWRGESLYALGNHAEAAKAYAASAAKEGFYNADYATVRQADALTALKQYAEAAAIYASVLTKFPQSKYLAVCTQEAGKKFFLAGDFAKAQQFLATASASGGKAGAEAVHWLARSLLKQNKPDEAIAAVAAALKTAGEGPESATLLMEQADLYYEIPERRAESIGLYVALAAKFPADPVAPQALYMAAFAAMNHGDYPAALAHAQAFLKTFPNHELAVGAMHVMAETNLLTSNGAEAEKLFAELLQKAPADRDAEIWRVHRGTALYLQGKHNEAVTALQAALPDVKSPELVAEAWYRIGRSQVALKQWDAAIKSLQASLSAQPKWKLADDALLVMAYARQQANDYTAAKESAQRAIAEFPDSKLLDMAHFRLAECARLSGDLKTAANEYQLLIQTWPQSPLIPQALYGLGWAQLGQEDFAGAETTFSGLIDKHPGDKLLPRARYGRGIARRQLKNFQAAIEDLQASLAADPTPEEKSRARHVLGLCQKGLNKPEDAIATFSGLLQDDPKYSDAENVYFDLGWALRSASKEAEAAQTFTKLIQQFPDSTLVPDSLYLVGDIAFDRKDYKKAAQSYYAAMTKAGNTKLGEEAIYKLGLSYFLQNDFTNAQQTFAAQRAQWPQGPLAGDAAYMEAESLWKQDKFKEALAAYEQVKNPSSKEVDALRLLHAADAAARLNQWDKSLELANQCMAQFPDSPHFAQALYQKGWAQQNLGKLDDALSTYAQVVAKSNDEPAARAQFMTGEILFQQKKLDEAVVSFFKVAYGYSYPKWQADAMYEAARCFEAKGQKTQAVKQYQTLLEKHPESDKAPLAKQRLEALK